MTRGTHFETHAIHAGREPDPVNGATQTPIYQTTSYAFKDGQQAADLFALNEAGHIYSRLTNPTVETLEHRLAAMEGGTGATCAASGHAAQLLAFFNLMEPGDEFISSTKVYGGSVGVYQYSYKQFGWQCHFVDPDDIENFKKAITPKVKAIFLESPANPSGSVVDIEAVAEIANNEGIPLIVDATLATPYLCRPFDWGADLVVHSTTKYISGNGSSMGGAVIESGTFDWSQSERFKLLNQPEPAYDGTNFYEKFGEVGFTVRAHALGLRNIGGCMAPMNAFLTLLGCESLHVRMQRHVENAMKVAEFLESHPLVDFCTYASLPSSPHKALADKYTPKGAGALFTFGVKGGYEEGKKLVEACKLLTHLANVGDTRSLIIHPASTTHHQLSEEQLCVAGIAPNSLRVSIGLEHIDDIKADLDQALQASQK
jgi:O-acetylhomoserine (thiol)-lyase